VRGDDSRTNDYGPESSPERRGPRHAAPRKSLLTKLHMPTGKKAFALAAMPTAVFVGMGLTPRLAMADDSTDIPFAPGPCVTRSDEPPESQEPGTEPTPSATPSDGAGKDEAGKDETGQEDGSAAPEPSASARASAQDTSPEASGEEKTAPSATPTPTPTPTPSPTASKNPLDPLGVGDALKDLFDGPDKETAAPSPSATEETPEPSGSATPETPDKPVEKATDAAKDAADETADAIREAAGKAGKAVEELDDDVKGLDPVKDEDIPDGAKERFPCPTADPEALAAAELEQGVPLLPDDPWTLESSKLTLNGLDYAGIVEVKTYSGSVKKVLKFTAASIDIRDLHQLTKGPAGTTGHVKASSGSTSTIRDGEVTMYTEKLEGNLFGLIPITFSPETPPPVNIPLVFFTDVTVTQAGQFGGTLTVPGLSNYFTGGNS